MSIALVVRSYRGDFCWLRWSVASMQMRLLGVDERVLITPEGHTPDPETLGYFDKHIQTKEVVDGYVAQQIDKLEAYKHTDCEYLLYADSDVMFREKWDARSRVIDGKCLLHRSRYMDIPEWARHWQVVVKDYTGMHTEWEYMRSMPIMHRRECSKGLLAEFPELISRAEKIDNRHFSEFNLMGAFAEQHMPDGYVFSDGAPDQPCKVYWSHGGFTPEIAKEIRAMMQPSTIDRINRRVEERRRLIGWVSFFAKELDTGVGDTVIRLLRECDDKSSKVRLRKTLRDILDACSCEREESIKRLNEQYPYDRK